MTKKPTNIPVSDEVYAEMRGKLLQFFAEAAVNYDVDSNEPFRTDIANGRYTTIQLKEMVRALYKSGLLLEAPSSKPPNRIVYYTSPLGRIALEHWQTRP